MVDPDPPAYRMAEIRRHVDDLLALADRLAHAGPSSGAPSPALTRLYAEVEQLAAAVHETPPRRTRSRVTVPPQAEPRPPATPVPAPSATEYWFG